MFVEIMQCPLGHNLNGPEAMESDQLRVGMKRAAVDISRSKLKIEMRVRPPRVLTMMTAITLI